MKGNNLLIPLEESILPETQPVFDNWSQVTNICSKILSVKAHQEPTCGKYRKETIVGLHLHFP